MKLKPLGDKVVIRLMAKEEKTKSGIFLPESAKEKPQEAEVVAVGPGKTEEGKKVAPEVKVGDKVIYSSFSPTEVKVEGEELLVISENEIVAVIK